MNGIPDSTVSHAGSCVPQRRAVRPHMRRCARPRGDLSEGDDRESGRHHKPHGHGRAPPSPRCGRTRQVRAAYLGTRAGGSWTPRGGQYTLSRPAIESCGNSVGKGPTPARPGSHVRQPMAAHSHPTDSHAGWWRFLTSSDGYLSAAIGSAAADPGGHSPPGGAPSPHQWATRLRHLAAQFLENLFHIFQLLQASFRYVDEPHILL